MSDLTIGGQIRARAMLENELREVNALLARRAAWQHFGEGSRSARGRLDDSIAERKGRIVVFRQLLGGT